MARYRCSGTPPPLPGHSVQRNRQRLGEYTRMDESMLDTCADDLPTGVSLPPIIAFVLVGIVIERYQASEGQRRVALDRRSPAGVQRDS